MTQKQFKYSFLYIILFILVTFNSSFPQQKKDEAKKDKDNVSQNYKALNFFIEAKSLELRNNFIGAVENYRTALKFDKAPGIYHALAEVYYKLYKPDEALIEINNALKLNPDNQNYLETLANIYIAKKDFGRAVTVLENIIKLDSNYTYGLYSLARLYQELNMPAQAIVIYEKITSKIGYDFDVLNKMYDIYVSYKNYDKATEVLEAMLQLDPFNLQIKALLASLFIKNNKLADARRIYEEIYILNPDDKEVQTELVKIYFKQNESDKAFQNFGKMLGKDSLGYIEKVQIGELYYNLISQDESAKEITKNIFTGLNIEYPDEWIPYYYLGVIDVLNKNENDYKEKFDKAIANADTSREVYINIGFAYFQQGKGQDAITITDEGLNKFPADFRLNYIKGLSLQQLGQERDAIIYFEKAIEANPNDIGVLSTLALSYDTQGQFAKSTAIYERALKLDPQNILILNNYAYNLSERSENLEKALSMSKIVIEKDPNNASYLDTMGWIYFKLKNYKLARKFIEKSLDINSGSAVVLEHLGDIYNAMKDNTNALKYWKQSLEKNPENKTLKEKIEYNKIS
ncbi:MAG: tetratricopeptide repeat protein [Bacteroidota bacterium]|nr:tetratricopeptide repeat protein [Bacteroidota bacterium]